MFHQFNNNTMEEGKEVPTAPNAALLAIVVEPVLSKASAQGVANALAASVADGKLDRLETWARMTFAEQVAEAYKSDVAKAAMVTEIAKQSAGSGKVVMGYGTFATRSVGTTFQFDHDAEWCDLRDAIELLKEMKDRREKYLKVLPGATEETYRGEKLRILPATKVSRDGFAFSLNK
jgi:DNA-binding transcriptional regulator/RsmH inhibitor MraZ